MKEDKKTGIVYMEYNQNKSGLPLVMLHGHGADHQAFDDLIDYIDCPLVLIDLPGFGSSKCLENNSIPEIAKMVAVFLQNIGFNNYQVLGHSFGTLIGIQLAANNKRCKKLILLNPLPSFKPLAKNLYTIGSSASRIMPGPISELVLNSQFYKTVGYVVHARQSFGRNYINYMISPTVRYGRFKTKAWRESWLSILETNQPELASQVHCPVLILHGDRDSLTTVTHVEKFATCFPRAQLVRFRSGGHIMHREITTLVDTEINRFLSLVISEQKIRVI